MLVKMKSTSVLNFKVEVPNEVVRDLVYQKLGESEVIKIVL